ERVPSQLVHKSHAKAKTARCNEHGFADYQTTGLAVLSTAIACSPTMSFSSICTLFHFWLVFEPYSSFTSCAYSPPASKGNLTAQHPSCSSESPQHGLSLSYRTFRP